MASPSGCVLVKAGSEYEGRQGLRYLSGLTGETVGSRSLCVTMARLPPGARSRAHLHRGIESAGYVIDGVVDTWFGERLEHRVRAERGDLVYIPPDVPHVAVNPSERPATALVVHTAANDQEGIVLLPELDGLVA